MRRDLATGESLTPINDATKGQLVREFAFWDERASDER